MSGEPVSSPDPAVRDAGDPSTARRSPGARLRGRLPELLVEASFIFLAVLLALLAEEWRERKDRRELAERALSGIVAEIRANRDEIVKNQQENRAQLEDLRDVIEAMRAGVEPDELSINYDVSLTSTAAWEAARMSQAVHFMSLEVVTDLAELYELQELFERTQDGFMDSMVSIGTRAREDPLAAAREAHGRIAALVGYRSILVQVYDHTLEALGGGGG